MFLKISFKILRNKFFIILYFFYVFLIVNTYLVKFKIVLYEEFSIFWV